MRREAVMTIQDFVIEAERAVTDHFRKSGRADIRVKYTETLKANDNRVHGLMLIPEGDIAGRSIYVDDLFYRHEAGEPIRSLLDEIVDRCENGLLAEGPPVTAALELDFERVRTRLTVRLLGVRNNISYMAERPYIDVGNGLALIAVINSEDSALSEWVVAVTNELMREEIRCDRETLLTEALKNTMEIEPPLLMSLEEHMYSNLAGTMQAPDYLTREIDPEQLHRPFVLTNASSFQGSAVLFYPGVMERIAQAFGCGYYVLPSSIHELIILPDVTEPDVNGLKETVVEANLTVISREDLLSWDVLHYDPEAGMLSVA